MNNDELYKILIAASHHVQNRIAASNNNLLLGNSILIVAWATLYASHEQYTKGTTVWVLGGMSVLGWVLGIAWTLYGVRSHEYMDAHTRQAQRLESVCFAGIPRHLWPIAAVQPGIRRRWGEWAVSFAPSLVILTGVGFLVLHSLLFAVTLYSYATKAAWDAAMVGWFTAVPVGVGAVVAGAICWKSRHMLKGKAKRRRAG